MSYHDALRKKVDENTFFRQVLYTGSKSQLVAMHLNPGEDIGMEIHPNVEQILFIHSGKGKVTLNGEEKEFAEGDVIVVDPGVEHNFTNTGSTPLKIYTVYSPANHIDGRVHKTKQEAIDDVEDEEFGHGSH